MGCKCNNFNEIYLFGQNSFLCNCKIRFEKIVAHTFIQVRLNLIKPKTFIC